MTRSTVRRTVAPALALALGLALPAAALAQRTYKPALRGQHWAAITGKPLGATAGALTFAKGGNAVDAACAMLAATATMWDVLSWGGETQALIYHPERGEVIGINALGVAPTGATPEHYREQGHERYPPPFGPLAAVTPGTPGGLLVMLKEFGRLSLAEVLAPAIEMADGYPIEAQAADAMERHKERIKQWQTSPEVFLPHRDPAGGSAGREAPHPGEIFRQPHLAATLRKLVQAEAEALAAGASREEAIQAAYDRFYRGDIAQAFVAAVQDEGGLITLEDLDRWEVKLEEPVTTDYRGIEVHKLTSWTQGPVMLQMLNILETFDLKAMGFNSAAYTHTVTQAMQLAFADRDFYYGDPYFPPAEPLAGLLSKEYAEMRAGLIVAEKNDADARPGDPYAFQEGDNPFLTELEAWHTVPAAEGEGGVENPGPQTTWLDFRDDFYRGTTSIQAADADGWVVSITPSGGWIPAVIAGSTGVGLSQRAQSFVLDPADNPYNVIAPGKRPRATLTPGMALKDGLPYLSFAVQGGDSQDQNLLQFFLAVVEFGMGVQQAAEGPNFNTYQLRGSFGDHESRPGRLLVNHDLPPWVRAELEEKGYDLVVEERTSGPINAIFFDRANGAFVGGSSHHGEDYGIAW